MDKQLTVNQKIVGSNPTFPALSSPRPTVLVCNITSESKQ
jgi:hypothetical protein